MCKSEGCNTCSVATRTTGSSFPATQKNNRPTDLGESREAGMLPHVLPAGSVRHPAALSSQKRRLVFQSAGLNLALSLGAQLSNFCEEMNHVPHFKDAESA